MKYVGVVLMYQQISSVKEHKKKNNYNFVLCYDVRVFKINNKGLGTNFSTVEMCDCVEG